VLYELGFDIWSRRQNVSSAGFPNPHLLGVCRLGLFWVLLTAFSSSQMFTVKDEYVGFRKFFQKK
jgi:hypothetical protein